MSGLPEIYVLHGLKQSLKSLKMSAHFKCILCGRCFWGKIDDSEQMTEINILLKQIWQTNRGNLRITRLFWDHAFVAKKNLENPKRPRPFNRMCKGCVSNASFLVFVGFFFTPSVTPLLFQWSIELFLDFILYFTVTMVNSIYDLQVYKSNTFGQNCSNG